MTRYPQTFYFLFYSNPMAKCFFFLFQLLKNFGLMAQDAHLPWDLNKKEAKSFEVTWKNTYRYYEKNIKRQRERESTKNPVTKKVLEAEEKLKSEHLICPDKYSVFGGIVPCRRKNARKMTYVLFYVNSVLVKLHSVEIL